MKHRSHKAKFGSGFDANRMLLRKLAYNFIKSGKMVTTEKRAKALQSYVESLVQKTKNESESNRNFLLKYLGSSALIKTLYTQVAPAMKDKKSGYITVSRLHKRMSDGSSMSEIRWSVPVVMEEPKKETIGVTQDKKTTVSAERTAQPARKKAVKKV